MLAPFIHIGGQITARMDCDLPPGVGGSLVTDLMICHTLHARGWKGIVEFDCRPIRTTTTPAGLKLFLRHSTAYWRMLEQKVAIYQSDPIIKRIRAALDQSGGSELEAVLRASQQGSGVVGAVGTLTKGFTSFEAASGVDTDVIEAHAYRLIQIAAGTHEQGAALFAGTPWRP
jgi:hypothetical protein